MTSVDGAALLKSPVQFQLADGGTQSRLGKLHGTEHVIADAVGGFLGVHHLKVKHAVDIHAHVVFRDAGLFGHVQNVFFQGAAVGHGVNEGDEDMEACEQNGVELAEPLDHHRLLVRHDKRRLEQDENNQQCQENENRQRRTDQIKHIMLSMFE